MEEVGETKEQMEERLLAELKELIRECDNKHLKAVIDQDEYLKAFIIGRKYDVKHAFETAKGLMNAKHGKYKDVFAMPPESVRHVIESGFFGVLKHKDKEGRMIGFMRIPKLDIKSMEYEELLRTAILFVESYWNDRMMMENGQTFIIDYTGYNFTIFKRYSFTQKLNFAMLFLNNYPTRFKEAHVYNNPRLVGYTYQLIKPFLPEKLKKRIFLHSYNRENLLNHFSPDILPIWMGGNLTDEEALDHDLVRSLLNKKNNCDENSLLSDDL